MAGGTFPASIWADFMRVVVERDGGSGSFPLPNNPVSWSPFSSDFTRSAGEANSELRGHVDRLDRIDADHRAGHDRRGAPAPAAHHGPAPRRRRPPPRHRPPAPAPRPGTRPGPRARARAGPHDARAPGAGADHSDPLTTD